MVTAAELRELALGLPGAQERETWGHPTFRVRDKIFASMYEGDDGVVATVKASPRSRPCSLSTDPATLAPLASAYGWTTIRWTARPDELRGWWSGLAPHGAKRAMAALTGLTPPVPPDAAAGNARLLHRRPAPGSRRAFGAISWWIALEPKLPCG
jgi:hypothetical protein